jgi:hypothetical protein
MIQNDRAAADSKRVGALAWIAKELRTKHKFPGRIRPAATEGIRWKTAKKKRLKCGAGGI